MRLEHPNLPEFEPLIRNLHKTAFTTGQHFLHREGIKSVDELKIKPHLFKPFIKHCHKGYDSAQNTIAQKLIHLHELKVLNEELLNEARTKKEKDRIFFILDLLQIINSRIIVLRRIADSIAFTLLQGKVWVARRFILQNKIKDIDINAIKNNLKEAIWLNDKDKLKFALVSDITTFIDVGDLLQIDFRKSPPEWEIIELKKGTVNKLLGDILEKDKGVLDDKMNDELEIVAGKHAPQQFKRMLRQKERMENIIEVVRDNKGKDIQTGKQLILTENELVTESYGIAIGEAIEQANDKGFSIHLVDRCLYVIATRDTTSALHIVFHLMNPEQSCAFMSKDAIEIKIESEAIRVLKRNHFIVDLANHNMYAKSSSPFFLYPLDTDTMLDMLFDRLKVLLFLNVSRFGELCTENGYRFELCSRKETEVIAQEFGRKTIPLYNNRIIKLISADGTEFKLLGGTFHKMFFDIIRPSEILRIHRISEEEFKSRRKANP